VCWWGSHASGDLVTIQFYLLFAMISGCYPVLSGFIRYSLFFIRFSLFRIRFYPILSGFIVFYPVLFFVGFGFYPVLSCFIRFYPVLFLEQV
jgi:hypothetical protein